MWGSGSTQQPGSLEEKNNLRWQNTHSHKHTHKLRKHRVSAQMSTARKTRGINRLEVYKKGQKTEKMQTGIIKLGRVRNEDTSKKSKKNAGGCWS